VLDYYDGRFSFNDLDLILTYKHILLSEIKAPSKIISNIGMYDLTHWQYKIKYVSCDSSGWGGIRLLDLKKLYYQFRRTLDMGQKDDIIISDNKFEIKVNTHEIVRRMICEKR
jgi:hypothetical protein